MNKKLLTMVTTGAIAISNMSPAFAEGFMATPDDSEFPMFVDGGFIPGGSGCVPKGEKPIFEKIPNAHIPEIEMLMEEFDDEAVEMGDDIVDDVLSGEEYEEEEIDEEVTDEDEPIDEEIIDEAEMERLEREEHEKELAEKEEADDDIMDEIEKDAEKYDKENEEDTIGGIDDDYYDVGEEEEVKDEDPAENIPDEKEEVKESNNKEATHNATVKDTNVSNNTARAIDKSTPSKLKEYQRELEEPLNLSKGNSANPKTGDMGIIGSIVGMVTAVGGIIFARKKL